MSSRFTGSDIRSMCILAATICDGFVESGPDQSKRLLTMAMFEKALRGQSPTATKAAISSIRAFTKEIHPAGIKKMQEFEADEFHENEWMLKAK
ncbi:mitochondrial aaa [Apiospora phragmitis]|uniref:Mitochondrial aaa n=1 Tax=Apiospora phragmitis TaxID=2905665 RepID=A0ABR1U8Z2_9PEZI